jgi:hypothetical protein
MTANNSSKEVEKCHQIGNCRFSSGEAMLIWMKFNMMRNMIMDTVFKQLRDIVENRDGSVIAHGGVIASFKYWYNSSIFPCSREILLSQAQVEYMPKNGNENG